MVDTLSLEGRIAIITGSGRENGIGAAIGLALARNGASVTINYVSPSTEPRANKVKKTIEDAGGNAIVVQADVTTPEGTAKLVKETLEGFQTDKIDILINNAGAVYAAGKVLEATPEDIDKQFAVTVRGPLMLIQAAVPHMSQHGRIINISSIASKMALAGCALYASGKAAMDCLTFAMASELGKHGKKITINTVAPGQTDTGILDPEAKEAFNNLLTPLTRVDERPGQPEDIADIVLLLCSEKSRWITGQYISASGGITGN